MKVAIVHDTLVEFGGAERVLDSILEIYPKATLYTFFFNTKNKIIYSKYKNKNPHTSFFQNLQFLGHFTGLFSLLKPFALIYFYFLNLTKYDLVISSSCSYNAKFVRKNKKSIHVCYLHAPPRYLYAEKNQMGFIKVFPFNVMLVPGLGIIRFLDRKAAYGPDVIIANSLEVQKRIKKYYGRKSTLLYPPVKPELILPEKSEKKYYLCHSRLVQHKGMELAIKTAKKYKLPLKIIGDGYLRKKLEKMAGESIEFLGFVKDKDLPGVYASAIALIYCPTDEDFGIVPVESMSMGVPVVGFNSAGVKETVVDGKTGVLFNEYSVDGLYKAISRFNSLKIFKASCKKQAKKFSKETFKKQFRRIINNYI